MSLVFCNSCFLSKGTSNVPYYCTSCSHVFCRNCLSNYENFCLICKAKCRVLEINQNLPENIRVFFDKAAVKQKMEEAEKIFQFQTNQSQIYFNKPRDVSAKYEKAKIDSIKLQKMDQEFDKTVKEEKELIEKLKISYK